MLNLKILAVVLQMAIPYQPQHIHPGQCARVEREARQIQSGQIQLKWTNPANLEEARRAALVERLRLWVAERVKRIRVRKWRVDPLRFAQRVVLEAGRHKLDPVAFAVIAWIESDYKTRLGKGTGGVGRRAGEVGLWQLIPGDYWVKKAAEINRGCSPGSLASKYTMRRWMRQSRGRPCAAQDVWSVRRYAGYLSKAELRDLTISTYVAGLEIQGHMATSRQRRLTRKLVKLGAKSRRAMGVYPKAKWGLLERYCHYNWGPKYLPGHYYRGRLFRRYVVIRKHTCED